MRAEPVTHAPEEPPPSAYRYERKFLVAALGRAEIETAIRLHPALFSAIFHARHVNNIYLDTPGCEAYFEAVNGDTNRVKARIRWYGAASGVIAKPVLEFKIKRGLVGRKASYPLAPFPLDGAITGETLRSVFDRSDLPEPVREYLSARSPALLNRYLRTYHRSADGRFRITVDDALTYASPGAPERIVPDRVHRIVELKYAEGDEPDAHRIASRFPFRLTKSSKYVMGLNALGVW